MIVGRTNLFQKVRYFKNIVKTNVIWLYQSTPKSGMFKNMVKKTLFFGRTRVFQKVWYRKKVSEKKDWRSYWSFPKSGIL